MAWKLDEQGSVVSQEGSPIWIGDDGSENAFDAKANIIAAATARREAAEARTALKAEQAKVASFDGIEDPAAALKALAFAASLDGKKVMGDEEIEKMFQARLKPVIEERDGYKAGLVEKDNHIYKMEVSQKFAASSYLKEKTIFGATPDLAEAYFGPRFKVTENQRIGYDLDGQPIWSSVNAGKYADFDEAVAHMINSHPQKDHFLKGSTAAGSGAQQGAGAGGTGNKKQMTRTQVDTLDPSAKMDFFKGGGTIIPE